MYVDKNGTVEDLLQEAANEVTDIHPGYPTSLALCVVGGAMEEGRM